MLDRQKRLNEVYEHLHNYFNIHTKGDFADSIKYARAYISSALNGNKKYLTDKLFINICDAYPGVFNLDYLLTGEGSLLADTEEKQVTPAVQQPAADLFELYAQRVRLVDDLRVSLKEELAEVRALRTELQKARDDFRDATYRLNRTLAMFTVPTDSSVGFAAEESNK